MHKVLITTGSFAVASPDLIELLKKHNLEPVMNPYGRVLRAEELKALLGTHRPSGILAGTEKLSKGILESVAEFLKVISRVGTGWDNIDREAAARLGIRVYRTEGILTQSVAELTVGLILSALRRIVLHDRLIRDGGWEKQMGGLLEGKKVGIIGFGAIGRCVGQLVHAFGASVICHDPSPGVNENWVELVSLNQLLKKSDIISLHADGNQTILGGTELHLCKPGVIIINTARGGLIDEKALSELLAIGRVGFACLDVFLEEPYTGALRDLDNVILTPHVGSYTRETRHLMEETAIHNLIIGLKEKGIL